MQFRRTVLLWRSGPLAREKQKATHLPESGTDILAAQDLLGHVEVGTRQIYSYVMNKPGLGIRSPLEAR